MIYGLYQSAAGMMTDVYKQDVISNNLANSETVGFRRDVATFRQRMTAAQENAQDAMHTDSLLEGLGGGTFADPTGIDLTPGDIQTTNAPLDAAIVGRGFFTVADADGTPRLTRNGGFRMDRAGRLTLNNAEANPVLDRQGNKINLDPTEPVFIESNGLIEQSGHRPVQLGLVDVANPKLLRKQGATLMSVTDPTTIAPIDATVVKGALERANVDPATELTALMATQRELQANANMIQTQDSMLDKLINTAGKIS